MYKTYYGLKEKPFKLVPNPDYLYLSKQHEIALAHLTYAVRQGDGFVVITGEVGTGKTTLCRNFLERLDENTASAYIFHPKLDSVELLTSICNEFGIRTNHTSVKQLIDVINGYLILQSKAGRKVVLLIDEAQNLSFENLEMVRMLSNLETTRSKLLQIILVGQPELSDKLDSYELRQLAQRISLTAHLAPLSYDETTRYIHHRVHIAAQRALTLFTPGACRLIFKYSSGIPRVINIASDRALLTAFSLERPKVTGAIAKLAIQELASRGRLPRRLSFKRLLTGSIASLTVFIAAGLLFYNKERITAFFIPIESTANHQPLTSAGRDSALEGPVESLKTYKIYELASKPTPAEKRLPDHEADSSGFASQTARSDPNSVMQNALGLLDHQNSRFAAVGHLLALWEQPHPNRAQLPSQIEDAAYFDIAAHQYGLRMHPIHSDWALVKQLNLPVIVALKKGSSGQLVYAAMEKWDQRTILLKTDAATSAIETDFETLLPFLHGTVYVFWRNILGFDAIITEGAPEKAMDTIKTLLRKIGYDQIATEPVFDRQTRKAIIDFQKRNFLEPDGLIGPLTKILLIKEADATNYPTLSVEKEGGGA